jgi:hypothetical protein
MVAAAAGISVEQNTNVWIVCFAQTLDVNARALVFRHNGIVFECFLEKVSVIIRPADAGHESTQIIIARIGVRQHQQSISKTVRAKRKPALMI